MKTAQNSVLIVILQLIFVLWLGRLAFASSEAKAVLVGADLELRCNQTNNATWWFDGKRLHGNTNLVNKTLILKIYNVTMNNQGTYCCGLSWNHGYNVSVIVGNVPSAPRSVYHDSYEWVDRVHWVASLYTGGLPVYYMVTAQCLHPNDSDINCNDYKGQQQKLTSNIHHVKDKKYICKLLLDLYQQYQVCVFAINKLGKSSNCIILKRSDEKSIPAPPPDFKAKEVRQGEVLLSWAKRKKWFLYLEQDKDFAISLSYSKIGDSHNTTNKTLIIPAMLFRWTIPDLKANSDYTFYAQCQYRLIAQNLTFLSSPAYATLHTQNSNPDKPPQNLKCNGSASYSKGKRNISISWEPPPKSSQNGELTKYILQVYTGQKMAFNHTVNASQTSAVLSGLNDIDNVRMVMTVCNEAGCSGIGEPACTVSGIIKTKDEPSPTKLIVVSSVIAAIVILLACVVLYFYKRYYKKSKREQLPPVGPVIDDDLYVDQYAEADGLSQPPEEYTDVYLQDMEAPLI